MAKKMLIDSDSTGETSPAGLRRHHQHDVEGAQQLGIQTIWINHKAIDWPGGNRPGAIIHHLGELPDALIRFESARAGFSTDREGGEKYRDHRRQPLWQGRP